MRHTKLCIVTLLVAASTACVASAQSTWTGTTGNWNDGANWSAGVPADLGTATIDNGGTAQVDALILPILTDLDVASSTGSTGSLQVLAGGNVASNRIRIGQVGTGTATVTDGQLIAGGGSIFVGSSDQSAGGLTGNGTLTLNDGAVALSDDDFQIASQGTGTVNFNPGSYATGVFTVVGKFGSGTWNQTGGVFAHSGGDIEIGDGGRPNQIAIPGPREGEINLSGGAIQVNNRFAISNRIGSGVVNISGGGLAITRDGDTEIGNGRENTLHIGRGADWTPADVAANPSVANNTATLNIIGDDSVILVGLDLEMDVKGVLAASNLVATITGPTHTPLLVGRNAKIRNGNFLVDLEGYSPVAGDQWSIIRTNADLSAGIAAFDSIVAAENVQMYTTVGNPVDTATQIFHNNNAFTNNPIDPDFVGVEGPFKSLDFSAAPLASGLAFEVEYLTNEVLLKVVSVGGGLPGDANADGKVDLLDLDILGANFGATGNATVAQGDFNADANVDLLDLDILGANFGAMAMPAHAAAVPEPTAMALILLTISGFGLRRRG